MKHRGRIHQRDRKQTCNLKNFFLQNHDKKRKTGYSLFFVCCTVTPLPYVNGGLAVADPGEDPVGWNPFFYDKI